VLTSAELFARCPQRLAGHGDPRSLAQTLRTIADSLDAEEMADVYGVGAEVRAFEAEVADLLGMPDAVFMPSGTMAQQIALRIWCDCSRNPTVAMHPTSHLEFAEHLGYQFLHNIHRLQFGAPEFVGRRLLTLADFVGLSVKPGAIILELPMRPLGGLLPAWDELVKISNWARENQIPLHLDGARIWQCEHFYQQSLAQIAALFDSVYVSFYKDLGGLAGCMLLGDPSFIAESRVWQRRHGGNLYTQGPYVAAARLGLRQRLPEMSRWVVRAQQVARIFSAIDGVIVNPDPPQVNLFQLFIKGDAETLTRRHHELAERSGTFLFSALSPAAMPGYGMTEIHIWENAMAFDVSQLVPFMQLLLAPTSAETPVPTP
jgi:threonine aldolase